MSASGRRDRIERALSQRLFLVGTSCDDALKTKPGTFLFYFSTKSTAEHAHGLRERAWREVDFGIDQARFRDAGSHIA
jgi:hypothetical protein